MREDVCLVLNERETAKAKIAETVELKLKELNITSSRLDADPKLPKVLSERCPKVVVLDYLLGDFTTGLDVLENLNKLPSDRRPVAIFLTDEPSVPVAVQAMRLGARHYLELDNPQSVANLIGEIQTILAERTVIRARRHTVAAPTLDNLVAQSSTSMALLQRARVYAQSAEPLVVITGPAGVGRSTLAQAIQNERPYESTVLAIDLDIFTGSLADLLGLSHRSSRLTRLGDNLSIIIDHAESDDGELLLLLEQHRQELLARHGSSSEFGSSLTICSSDSAVAQTWGKTFSVEPISIPSLSQRKDDLVPLVQRFVHDAGVQSDLKIKPFDSATLKWIADQRWPGELRQLRALVVEAAVGSALGDQSARQLLEAGIERWDTGGSNSPDSDIDALMAARILEQYNHNFRVAAAALGIGTMKLRRILTAQATQ